MITVLLCDRPINKSQYEKNFRTKSQDCGAIVGFTGCVRRHDEIIPLAYLFIEHYPFLTEQEIYRIALEARKKWHLKSIMVLHRIGQIFPNEDIVYVFVSASHRAEAFEAAEFIMDYLKTEAPFWKKEFFQNGTSRWVEAKNTDLLRKNRWINRNN